MIGLSLFSGIGGFEYGFQIAGLEVKPVGYVEINSYCQEVLKARFKDGTLPAAPIWPDICTFDGKHLRELVDIVYGGFPCQPHSTAGRRLGEADPRNLWPEMAKVIGDIRPRYVLLENAGIHLRKGSRPAYAFTVLADLAALGYVGVWGIVGAHDVGAPHKRDRWWCLAHQPSCGLEGGNIGRSERQGEGEGFQSELARGGCGLAHARYDGGVEQAEQQGERPKVADRGGDFGTMGNTHGAGHEGPGHPESPGFTQPWPPGPRERDAWAEVLSDYPELAPAQGIEPHVRRVADGFPHRRKRLAALGNAIVPAVAAEFLRRLEHAGIEQPKV